ncbi:MAG: hydantoinase/oxoprolinase family protein [Negativicutes bacterium]|nr:hydantoinase/oxoprolinase family protein [Negativicutes bacterium]
MGNGTKRCFIMLLGVDVGGTFTDAVLVGEGKIINQAKVATTQGEVLQGILQALDEALKGHDAASISRVVVSSTIVTNALTEGKVEPVFLAVMAGPGMSTKDCFPVEPYLAEGYVDHRGQIIKGAGINRKNVEAMMSGKELAAVSGKFAVRNQTNEQELRKELKGLGFEKIFAGSEISGELNFIRRTNSAYFSAAVYRKFQEFILQVEHSMQKRGIIAPIQILKADGGTLPLAAAPEQSVEAIFTGPAASVLGIEALGAPMLNAISLDVGGTTTDIAFWKDGGPLLARRGAKIAGYPTAVRAFHMRSIGLGGDSRIKKTSKGFEIGPDRVGPAMALGGKEPTLSDALITIGCVSFGDAYKARVAMSFLAEPTEAVEGVAEQIVAAAIAKIENNIQEMIQEWDLQPVYTVNDVLKGTAFVPELLVGVGGGAPGLIQALGLKMGLPVEIPVGAMVANAVGAALSRPTLTATLRADTTEGYYIIPEAGIREKIPHSFSCKAAEEILADCLLSQAAKWQLEAKNVEVIACEEFPTIHDFYTTGKIIYLKMQLKPGIIYSVTGQEVAF